MTLPPALLDLTPTALAALMGENGRPSPTRARAFLRWLWQNRPIPEELPEWLPEVSHRIIERIRPLWIPPSLELISRESSSDGTVKLLSAVRGHPVETVVIPGRERTTVCISTQSGCSRACAFCATAKMGFRSNLTSGEMVSQVLLARSIASPELPVRNVVFMGMGEPMDNLASVLGALEAMTLVEATGLSASHVTVSTCGVLPGMREFVARSQAELALSLHAPDEERRRLIMPIDRRYPLSELLSFLAECRGRRIILVEYLLMGGFNDSSEDAHQLAGLMASLPVRVNLIPLNPSSDSLFVPSSPECVRAFFEILNGKGIRTMVRFPRGQDIAAACGQLAGRALGGGAHH